MPRLEQNGTKWKAGGAAAHPLLNGLSRLAVEDVIADRGDALGVPGRRHVARMEEQRVAGSRSLSRSIDDLGDGHGSLPLLVGMLHVRQRMAMNE